MPQVEDTNVHVNIYMLKYNSQFLSRIARKQRTKALNRLGEGHIMPKNLAGLQRKGVWKCSACAFAGQMKPYIPNCTVRWSTQLKANVTIVIVRIFPSTNVFKLSWNCSALKTSQRNTNECTVRKTICSKKRTEIRNPLELTAFLVVGKKKKVKRSSHHYFPTSCLTRKFWKIIEPEEWPAPLGIDYTIKQSPVYIPRLAQEIGSVRSWELTFVTKGMFSNCLSAESLTGLGRKTISLQSLDEMKNKKGTNATAHCIFNSVVHKEVWHT